jgi:hypothetical protein
VETTSIVYPNLYVFLIGRPGVGKTRTINEVRKFLTELKEFQISPNSLTAASLVDSLLAARRIVHPNLHKGEEPMEFHSMMILADDFSLFLQDFKAGAELIGAITAFYDVTHYEQRRRTTSLHIRIPNPQLSILAGTTPGHHTRLIPDWAYDQGFTSRLVLIYSNDRPQHPLFGGKPSGLPSDMVEDLGRIFALRGQVTVEDSYKAAIKFWRDNDEHPKPDHPKLANYNTRRLVSLLKLSIIASVDRSDRLRLTDLEFSIALGWLQDAEGDMPNVFTEGAQSFDGKSLDEVAFFVKREGRVSELKLMRFISSIFVPRDVLPVLKLLEITGRIVRVGDGEWGAPSP